MAEAMWELRPCRIREALPGASDVLGLVGLALTTRPRRNVAEQECKREEREAVRRAQEEGDVKAARGQDRQRAGLLEPRRKQVGVGVEPEAGRDLGAEEGSRTQGRPRKRQEELAALAFGS